MISLITAWIASALTPPTSLLRRLHEEQRGQDTFEYVLIIGVVVVAVVAAVITPVGSTLITFVVNQTSTAIAGLFS